MGLTLELPANSPFAGCASSLDPLLH